MVHDHSDRPYFLVFSENAMAISSSIQQQYLADGFFLAAEPVLPGDIVQAAVAGMDAVREGRYDAGHPPHGSRWNPGRRPRTSCAR